MNAMEALKIIDTCDEKPAATPRLSLLKTHVWPSRIEKAKTSRPVLRLVPEMTPESSDISGDMASDVLFNLVDPSGLFSIVVGAGGTVTAVTGAEGSAGVFFNPGFFGQTPAAGAFGAAGASAGLNISGDVFAGVIFGGAENVAGTTANFNLSLGFLSLSGFFNPNNGSLVGFTVGFGPGATPVGASTAVGSTGTVNFFGGQPNACGR